MLESKGPSRLTANRPSVPTMRPTARLAAAVTLAFGMSAGATRAQVPPPPPPPPAGAEAAAPEQRPFTNNPDLEPQVTITQRDNETTEEVRIGGELKFVKVTPRWGRPYYLVPNRDGTGFIRRNSLDTSISVPQWVLFSW